MLHSTAILISWTEFGRAFSRIWITGSTLFERISHRASVIQHPDPATRPLRSQPSPLSRTTASTYITACTSCSTAKWTWCACTKTPCGRRHPNSSKPESTQWHVLMYVHPPEYRTRYTLFPIKYRINSPPLLTPPQITRSIIVADPHFYLLYRLFGTYLVQSSFIFLILARKFGPMSDQLILDNCAINLQVLDIFVQNSNMRYQRDFARTMRRTLEKSVVDREARTARTAHSESEASEAESLDPELLQYRWIAGYSGLWTSSTRERGG